MGFCYDIGQSYNQYISLMWAETQSSVIVHACARRSPEFSEEQDATGHPVMTPIYSHSSALDLRLRDSPEWCILGAQPWQSLAS